MVNNEKIRVLFLITDLGKGGAERYLIDLCSEMEKSDEFEFIVGSLFDNNRYLDLTTSFDIRVLNFRTYRIFGRNKCESYLRLLDEFKPHIVHTHRFLAEFLSAYYVRKDITYLCHGHDNMVQFGKQKWMSVFSKSGIINLVEKNLIIFRKYYRAKTWYIVNSNNTEEYYRSVMPRKVKDRIVQINCGFNFSKFHFLGLRSLSNKETIRILNVGSFQLKKNQAFFVEIAQELKKRKIGFEINLLGEGEFLPIVKDMVESKGLGDCINFLGNVDDVENWYHKSDIYMHTAWYEPFGLVLLEAMAAGLPVICLDGKGNRDIMEHGKNGFIFESRDAGQFADATVSLVNNELLYQQISEFGKKYAARFDSTVKNREMTDFYKKVLQRD